MRSVKLVALIVALTAGMSLATTTVTYTLELGGDNNYTLHEQGQTPAFTPGTVSATPKVVDMSQGDPADLTWAVRVSVSGAINTADGSAAETFGAANLVFDLELWNADASGTPTTIVTDFGAAPMACQSGTPGVAGALDCAPTGPGFWSSMNDGDEDGGVMDPIENAAFARSVSQEDPISQKWTLIDTPAGGVTGYPAGGPGFDYGWYPTANGRGGQDLDRSKPIDTTVTGLDGKLVGFGAGYTNNFYTNLTAGNGYLPGVGLKTPWGAALENYYFADDPYTWTFGVRNDTEDDPPLFEGQLSLRDLPEGTYVLKVVPSAEGTNVLHGDVQWYNQTANYGSYGSFAKKADAVVDSSQAIYFKPPPPSNPAVVSARKIFYNNSYYDGNNATIQPGPGTTNHDDDMDAVDTSKQALLPGDGQAQFVNWTGYEKGINGLVYEIDNVPAGYTISTSDFEFVNQTRTGTGANVITTATVQAVADTPVAGTTRVFITFPDNTITNCWLKVTVKSAGLGLVNGDDVSYWGNVMCESNTFTTSIAVNATDEVDARNHPSGFVIQPPTNIWDYNKDGKVNATDPTDARSHTTGFLTVTRITR